MGVALGLNLAPQLHAVRHALAPAAEEVRHVRSEHLARPLRMARWRGRGPPEVGIDGGTAHAKPLRDRGDRGALRTQDVDGLIARHPRGMALLLLRRHALLAGLRTLTL